MPPSFVNTFNPIEKENHSMVSTVHYTNLDGRLLQSSTPLPPSIPTVNNNGQTPYASNGDDYSTQGMILSLVLNLIAFTVFYITFEYNRSFKQIFLKRCVKKYIDAGRVPPIPPKHWFGWLETIYKVKEIEVLQMVGLDAYMCLRYLSVCLKLSLFLCFWGLIVLTPVYGTAANPFDKSTNQATNVTTISQESWSQYTIFNVMNGDQNRQYRLWIAAIFGYIFAAYFCQLLYAEYNNFSVRRLQYLVQIDSDLDGSSIRDPDTPQQKYYTIMIERIPPHLRSAQALYSFFNNLFPNEVYSVEVSLDIKHLNSLCQERQNIRNKLEKSIAVFEAMNLRQTVYINTGNTSIFTESNSNMIEDRITFMGTLRKFIAPEIYGYELFDAISYYTNKLIELNKQIKELQDSTFEKWSRNTEQLQQKFAKKSDTRAYAIIETIASSTTNLSKLNRIALQSGDNALIKKHPVTIESLIFGTDSGKRRKRLSKSIEKEKKSVKMSEYNEEKDILKNDNRPHQRRKSTKLSNGNENNTNNLGGDDEWTLKRFILGPEPIHSFDSDESLNQIEHKTHDQTTQDQIFHQPIKHAMKKSNHQNTDHNITQNLEDFMPLNLPPPIPMTESNLNGEQYLSDNVSSKLRRRVFGSNPNFHPEEIFQPVDISTITAKRRRSNTKPSIDKTLSLLDPTKESNPGYISPVPGSVEEILESDETFREWRQQSIDYGHDYSVDFTLTTPRNRSLSNPKPMVIPRNTITENSLVDNNLTQNIIEQNSITRNNVSDESLDQSKPISGKISNQIPMSNQIESNYPIDYHNYDNQNNQNNHDNQHDMDNDLLDNSYVDEYDPNEYDYNQMDSETQNLSSNSNTSPKNNSMLSKGLGFLGFDTGSNSNGLERTDSKSKWIGNMRELINTAKTATREGWEQTKLAGSGAVRGVIEAERAFEMLTLGAYYKYSSTAFVTFTSRITESIAHQMLLSHDSMEISHAPNPNDIIWANVAIPRHQVVLRTFITNISLIVASIFWSSLVTSVNSLSSAFYLPKNQEQLLSAAIMLMLLLMLPFVFDWLSRYYEGLKLESEIQNSILTRYFYYQMVNVYVTVGFGGLDIWQQIILILKTPHILVTIVGRTIPAVSLFFVNIVILKVFSAVPIEMCRPWQLSTIFIMSLFMNRRTTTRRELRQGVFYAWPMLYGWIYPQIIMVLIIMLVYSCIAPLLMPFCVLFFGFAYLMYKYQLLFVYINDYQSGGYMWYDLFNKSLIALLFGSLTLLGYLGLQLHYTYLAGPFFFFFPQPFVVLYFMYYCKAKFWKQSMNLSFGFAKELDQKAKERKAAGLPIPHDGFSTTLYRQPALTEKAVYPEPFRSHTLFHYTSSDPENGLVSNPRGSLSIDIEELTHESDLTEAQYSAMHKYFEEYVVNLAKECEEHFKKRKLGLENLELEYKKQQRNPMKNGLHHQNKVDAIRTVPIGNRIRQPIHMNDHSISQNNNGKNSNDDNDDNEDNDNEVINPMQMTRSRR